MAQSNPTAEYLTQNQFVDQVVDTYRGGRNRFCFILGAGASVESGIPTGTELEMRWMNCLMGVAEDYPARKKQPEETRKLAKQMLDRGELVHPFEEIERAWEKAVKTGGSIPSEYYFDIYSLRFNTEKESGYWYLEKAMDGCRAGKSCGAGDCNPGVGCWPKEPCRPSVGYHTLALMLTKNNLHNLVITTNFDSLVEDALFHGEKAHGGWP